MFFDIYFQNCISQAKIVNNKINSRDALIVTDAELSIIKVSQLERVLYHTELIPTVHSFMGDHSATWRIEYNWLTITLFTLFTRLL